MFNQKSIKKYIAFGQGQVIDKEPCSALLSKSNYGKNLSASDKVVLSLPAMNFDVYKSEFIKLHKQEDKISREILEYDNSFNRLYCDIIKSVMKSVIEAELTSGRSREMFVISHDVLMLMRNYIWIVTYFHPRGGHGSIFMEAQIARCGTRHNQYTGVQKCKDRAEYIQKSVNQLLTDAALYQTFTAMLRDNPNDTNKVIQQWLIATLDAFKLQVVIKKKKPSFAAYTQAPTDDANDSNGDDGVDDLLEDGLDIPEADKDDKCVRKVEDFKSLDPIMIEANPKISKEYVTESRQYIWDSAKQLNMNTGSCGIAGGVDGSICRKGSINLVSYIYEASPTIGIEFGSGIGVTAQLIAAVTNNFMYLVETNSQRYIQSLQNANKLLSTANTNNVESVEGNTNYANVAIYYNGPLEELESFKEKNPAPDCVNFTSIPHESFPPIATEHPELIGLVNWFQHGWSLADRQKVVKLLNTFTNMKYFCSDMTLSQLLSLGFDFSKHELDESLEISSRMEGSKSNRQYFVNIFRSTLPSIPDGFCRPTNTTDLSAAIEYYSKYSLDDKKSRAARNTSSLEKNKYVPEPFSTTSKVTKSTAATTKASLNSSVVVGKPTIIAKDYDYDYEFDNFDRIVFPSKCTCLKLKFKYIKEMKLNNKALVYTSLPTVNEDMLVNKFSQIGFNDHKGDTDSVYSMSTLDRIAEARNLIANKASLNTIKARDMLADLLQHIQLNVLVHHNPGMNASGFEKDDTTTQVTEISSALVTTRSSAISKQKFTKESYMIQVSEASDEFKKPTAFSNLDKPCDVNKMFIGDNKDDLNSNIDDDSTHTSKKSIRVDGDHLPDTKKIKIDDLAIVTVTPVDIMMIVDDVVQPKAVDITNKVQRTVRVPPEEQLPDTNKEKIDLTKDDIRVDSLITRTRSGKSPCDSIEVDLPVKPATEAVIEKTFFEYGLFSSAVGLKYYRLHVSKRDLNALSHSEKRQLEINPYLFLRTKPLVSVMKLKYRKDKDFSNNTAGNGRCSVLFPLQVRDKQFNYRENKVTKHKYSDDYEYFKQFVEEFLFPRIIDDDPSDSNGVRFQLQKQLDWLSSPFHLPGDDMPYSIEDENGKQTQLWFDATQYSNFNFPDYMRFSLFTSCEELFNGIASVPVDKKLSSQYLMLNYTNCYAVSDNTNGYIKTTLDEIPKLSNGLAGHYVKSHVFIIPQDWSRFVDITDEMAQIVSKVKSFINSEGYCPSGYCESVVLPLQTTVSYERDLSTLRPGKRLTDPIMSQWLYHINVKCFPNPEVCSFPDTNYFLELNDDGALVDKYIRWFERKKINIDQLRSFKYVVWTINLELEHWLFAVVSLIDFKCRVYDSNHNELSEIREVIKTRVARAFYMTIGAFNYFVEEKYPHDTPEFTQPPVIISQPSYPQQENGVDCGLFTLRGIAEFHQNPSTNFDFDQAEIYRYRDVLYEHYKTLLIDVKDSDNLT